MNYNSWLGGTKSEDIYEFYHNGPIIRGTNQEHSFKLPTTINAKSIKVTYKQEKDIILIKDLDINSLKLNLTEVDTFKFKANKDTEVQLKVITEDDKIVTSDKFSIIVEDSLYDLQLTNNENLFAIECIVNKFGIKAQEFFKYTSATNLKCKFTFDENWASFSPKAFFNDEYGHYFEVSIDNGECEIPYKILENPGLIHVGLYNKLSRSTVWSNPIRLQASCTFVPNNETVEPITPSKDTTTLYFGALDEIPENVTLAGLYVLEGENIAELLTNGKTLAIHSGRIDSKGKAVAQHVVFACANDLVVSRITTSDSFVLTEDVDYTKIEKTKFNFYYINDKTYDPNGAGLNYTFNFRR